MGWLNRLGNAINASHSARASTTPEPLFGAGTTPSLFVHSTLASNTCKGVV
eukprot:SAG11_NODE_4881_length_1735_cov_2.838020_2_plen_50_part_01